MRAMAPALAGRLGAVLLWLGGAAAAANLQISPVNLAFRPGQTALSLQLQNYGETPVFGQVRVYAWDQQGGDDVLQPTELLLASPPLMQIPPRTSQTIRLVRRDGGAAAGNEQSFRLLIDEIPPEDEAGGGVAIRLRYSVPVFMASVQDNGAPDLAWMFYRKDGAWHLRLRNSGSLHAQIGATVVANAAGKEYEVSKGLLGYALAGRTREWRLPLDAAAQLEGPLTIRTSINARPQTAAGTAAPP